MFDAPKTLYSLAAGELLGVSFLYCTYVIITQYILILSIVFGRRRDI